MGWSLTIVTACFQSSTVDCSGMDAAFRMTEKILVDAAPASARLNRRAGINLIPEFHRFRVVVVDRRAREERQSLPSASIIDCVDGQ